MVKIYTNEWYDFQFRAPVYLDGHFEPYKFDLVKWNDCDPYEVIDSVTGKKKTVTRNCFTVGTLIWDKKEKYFWFESYGLRYFEEHTNGLDEFILDFCETMKKQLWKDN